MKPKTLITLSFAIGCGLVAALLMKQASASKPVAQEAKIAVLTVIEQIDTGQAVTPQKVKFKEIPKSLVPEGAITSADQFDQRAVKGPAYPGEILTADRLGEKGVMGQSITIQPGYRVIGIPVDASNSFSGMLQPGDRVDILVTYRVEYVMPGNQKIQRTKTSTLLEYVQVFATDNRTVDKGADQYAADSTAQVHLLLTPEQATWVKLAQEKGRLNLAWRSELDTDLADVGTVADELLDELNGAIGGVDVTSSFGDEPAYAQAENQDDGGDFMDEEYGEDYSDEDGEEESEDSAADSFADFLAAAATEPAKPAEPMWSMQIFNGASPETFDVPLPEKPESTENGGDPQDGEASAIGTSASVLRQFLLGF